MFQKFDKYSNFENDTNDVEKSLDEHFNP